MWTTLTIVLVVLTAFVTSRVSARQAKQIREEEERGRRERWKAKSALEAKYLKEGIGDSWSNEFPDIALRSLGNLAYLIWLLNYEPKFRSFRGDGKNPYPPDWEWRRRFVLLRDRGICQGCKKDSTQGITLDCHHIRSIAEFGSDEIAIHSFSNLISLCPLCHAGQHPGNRILAGRAFSVLSDRQYRQPSSDKRSIQTHPPYIAKRTLPSPEVVEVQPSSDGLSRYISVPLLGLDQEQTRTGQSSSRAKANAYTKSITEGLAWVDKQIPDMKFLDAVRRCAEEDIYGNCDYCDKEILLNPFQISVSGKYLCDDCYSTTGGKE
jgi:hypothetical protein